MEHTLGEAVRALLGVDAEWDVGVHVSGGEEVQLVDYTWDTNPHEFEVFAMKNGEVTRTRTFDNFAECLNALLEANDK